LTEINDYNEEILTLINRET